MKSFRVLITIAVFSAILTEVMPVAAVAKMTARQAVVKARSASTPAEYRELSEFYRRQEAMFSAAAHRQQQEYEYALDHWEGKSYPQTADRARLLGDYYRQRAIESRRLAESFARKELEKQMPSHPVYSSK